MYQIFIKATPEQIWDAITKPEFTARYFHGARITVTRRPLRVARPDEPSGATPRSRCSTRRAGSCTAGGRCTTRRSSEETESRVTWEIEPDEDGVCKLTVTHDRLEGAPRTAESVSGEGWMGVLSGLKTLLETGQPLNG